MLVTILLSQGGRLTADIGDDDSSDAPKLVRELIDEGEIIHGVWGGPREYRSAVRNNTPGKLVSVHIDPDHVVAIST